MRPLVVLLLGLALCRPAAAAVSLATEDERDGAKAYVVENPWYRLRIIERVGAWCVSFRLPKDGPEWIPQSGAGYERGGNLFGENLTGRGFGTDRFMFAPRTARIVRQGPDEVVLEFTYDAKDEPRIVRTMTFRGDRPAIRVDLDFANTTGQSLYRGLWPKLHFWAGGTMEDNRLLKPWRHGIRTAHWDPDQRKMVPQDGANNDFLREAVAGWMAHLNFRTGTGLVAVMDYNYVHTLYNCVDALTTEWFYDDVPLMKNTGRWQTTYAVVPVVATTGIAYASRNLVVDHRFRTDAGGGSLAVRLAQGLSEVAPGRLTVRWRPLAGGGPVAWHDLPPLATPALTATPGELVLPLPGAPAGRSLVFECTFAGTADGRPLSETWTWLHEAKDARRFDLLAGKDIPVHVLPMPKKTRTYDKPKNLRVVTRPGSPLLEVRGPGYYRAGIGHAAPVAHIFDIKGSYMARNFNGSRVDWFPTGYEDLFAFNTIVLNDVDAWCLKDFSREMVVDFVRAGGGLLVIGGPYSLSHGGYHESQFAAILPVTLAGKPFSWRQLPADRTQVAKAPGAAVLKDVAVPEGMLCRWGEEVAAKPGASIEMTCGGMPFLTCWEVKGPTDTGRVAVIAGSVFGDEEHAFYRNPEWPRVLGQVLDWLNHGSHLMLEW